MGRLERLNPRGRHTVAAQALDGRGRVLQVDDEVLVLSGHPSFRVAEIAPVLDPSAPPGLVRVVLSAAIPFLLRSGFPDGGLMRISTAEEVHERLRAAGMAPPMSDADRPAHDTETDDLVPEETILDP